MCRRSANRFRPLPCLEEVELRSRGPVSASEIVGNGVLEHRRNASILIKLRRAKQDLFD